MIRSISRRAIIVSGTASILTGCADPGDDHPPSDSSSPSNFLPTHASRTSLDLRDLSRGQYGVWGSFRNRIVVHEPNTRLRMCSTMKLPLVALTLQTARRGRIDLDSVVSWKQSDIVGYSPFTSAKANQSATLNQLCEAAARSSDNTATNRLIDALGGLRALEEYARSLGDKVTRFDRRETAMNVQDGELDTTTAEAFGKLALTIAQKLGESDRQTLFSWLPTRDKRRIAAVTPADCELHHKTGTSGDGALNDVAILSVDQRVVGCLAIFTDSESPEEAVVVEIARRAFKSLFA